MENLDPLAPIQHSILQMMHRPEKGDSNMFITYHELREVWEHYDLRLIFPTHSWSDADLWQIRKEYLKTLSILILTKWLDLNQLYQFRVHFFRRPDRNDASLPLLGDQSTFLGRSEYLFQQLQYAFIPVVIKECDKMYVQEVKSEERLPFMENSSEIGSGGFGIVSKVFIAPRCLINETEDSENRQAKAVACKKYSNERSRDDFRTELRNLEYLKQDISQGKKRIMLHIASIVHGNDFMIILPLAELRDLEVFLRYGFEAKENTREEMMVYDFEKEFPGLTPPVLQAALFKELTHIAAALVWLHENLHVEESMDRYGSDIDLYCAHMDLKTDNILITRDMGSRVGKWMISDFGISVFDKRTDEMAPRLQSIRDVGHRLTSRTHQNIVNRGHGPYQPPEVDHQKVDGRKCDVWSFGCIVCDVLKFALYGTAVEGTRGLEKFRKKRWYGGDDYFYESMANTTAEPSTRNSSNTELKKTIRHWLGTLSSDSPQLWVRDCTEMLRKALMIDPKSRISAKSVMETLSLLPSLIAPGIYVRRLTDPSTVPIVVDPLKGASTDRVGPGLDTSRLSTSKLIGIEDFAQSCSHTPPTCPLPSPPLTPTQDSPITSRPSIGWAKKHIPSQGKVTSIALSANGDHIAILHTNCVRIYLTDESQTFVANVPLSLNIKWRSICMASPYLTVLGIQRSLQKKVLISDIREPERTINAPPITEVQMSKVLVSSQGIIAYVCGKQIILSYTLSASTNDGPESLMIDRDNTINEAAFGASGQWLCVWATGAKYDHCYFWDVTKRPPSLDGKGYYEKVTTASTKFTLWPCESAPACVLRESHGDTFIAHGSHSSNPIVRRRQHFQTGEVLTACVFQNHTLICIEEKSFSRGCQLSEYTLYTKPDGTGCMEKCSNGLTIADSIKPRASIIKTVLTAEGNVMITIFCTIKG